MTEEEQRNIPEDVEERLETFKQQKAKAKANFTLARHKLLALIDDDHPPRRNEVREECRKLDTALEKALCVMENLSEEYSRVGDRYNRRKPGREIEQLENEFTEAQNRAQDYLDKTKPESSSESSRDSVREGREEESPNSIAPGFSSLPKPSTRRNIFQLNHTWILRPSQVFGTKIKFEFVRAWMIETFIIITIGGKTRSWE